MTAVNNCTGARASKSIPNISFNDSLDSDGRIFKDRPLSRSSNTLDSEASRPYQELRPRSTGRGGPDVLVYYDTRPEDDNQAESTPACKSKTASLSKKLPGFLKLRKEEKVAPPIIEMVPVSTPPSTYQFPSRPSSNCVDPIYVQRPHFHRHPVPLGSSQYGITYPNYTPLGGGVYPSLPSPTYLAMGGAPGVFTSPRTPVLTTPRHPLSHYGSLQRAKVPLQDTGHSSTLPRQPGDGCIYGYMVPANRISGPPPISRTHSMDQSGKRTNSVDQSVNRISFDQSGPRGPQLEQSGHVIYSSRPTTGQPEKRVSTVGYIRVPDHRTSIIVENLSRLTNPVASRPDTVISTRDFCLEHPVNRFSQSQPEPPCTELQPVLKSEISKVADGSDPTKREPIKLESICDGSLQAPSSTIQSAPNTPVSTVQSIAKPSPTGGGPGALSDGGPTAVRSEHTMGNGVPAASRGLTTTAAGGVTTTVGVMTATAGGVATPTGGLATSAAGHTTTAAGLTTTAGGVVSPTGGVTTIAGGVGGRVVPTSVGVVVSLPLSSPKTPVLRKLGEKTPPGTLKGDRPNSSCKSWYTQYSQAFLSKTIDTPVEDLPPLGDEEFMEEDDDEDDSTSSEPSKESQKQRASIAKQPL